MDEVDPRAEVAQRLAAVSFTTRLVVTYVYVDGKSTREVAEMHGVTPGRIRQKIRQAEEVLGVSGRDGWAEWLRSFGDLLESSFSA